MHIHKIQIQGFKSFPDPVEFEFGPGITAVVGPNGCGKSNVLDALLWCFGSQSPRQLRGASMQDVIFAGSDARPAAGFAEVRVLFSNEEGQAPGAWSEVPEIELARRYERSGDGEYRMQGARVRLRDVQDFLMDLGFGEYSTVRQGTIGQLVQARPLEVRAFLEQASRMTRYRSRREEAQGRLASVEENLTRMLDLEAEVERSVRSLERQARRAETGLALRAEWMGIRRELLARREQQHAARLGDLEARAARLAEQRNEQETLQNRQEAELSKLHAEQATLDGTLLELEEQRRSTQREREVQQEALGGLRREREDGLARAEARVVAQGELRDRIRGLDQSLQDLTPRLHSLQANLARQRSEYTTLQERLAELRRESRLRQEQRETARSELVEVLRTRAEARSRGADARARLEHARQRLAVLQQAEAERRTAVDEARQRLAAVDSRHGATAAEFEAARVGLEAATEGKRSAEDRARIAEQAREAAYRRLRTLEADLEAVEAALRLQGDPDNRPDWAQELASPWEHVAPLPGFEDLVQTVLAQRFALWLARRLPPLAEAQQAASKERLRVLAIETGPRQAAPVPADCRPLSAFLQTGSARPAWLEGLLDGIWVREAPFTAFEAPPAGDWEEIWDPQGVCVDARGVWSVGPLSGGGGAHLAARRQRLEVARGEAGQTLAAAETAAAEALVALEQARLALEAAATVRTRTQEQLTALTQERQLAGAQLDEQEAALARLADELASLRDAARSAELEMRDGAQAESEAEAAEQRLRARLDGLEQSLLPVLAEQGTQEPRQLELAAELERLREQHATAEQERTRFETAAQGAREQLAALEAEEAAWATRRGALAEELQDRERAASALEESLEGLLRRIQEAGQRQTDLRNQLRTLETSLQQSLREDASLVEQSGQLARAIDEIRHARARDLERFSARFGEDWAPPETPDARDDEELLRLDAEVEARLERLGPWHAGAVEAHREELQRLEDMQRQRGDLEQSVASLRESIARMNRESRERFRQAFEDINRRFGEIFHKLFRGGRAELRLSEPGDWLESGIEIVAQPPGTNLQRLELLSGGQSAMTAISLILAIFLSHPSPFCVLDEVDAPLDDANVSRFNQVLVELNEIAQIFLITHNKTTMEIADALYGVTMEQRGISKVIPVRLG